MHTPSAAPRLSISALRSHAVRIDLACWYSSFSVCAVAAIAEQSYDEIGLVWPLEVAPAKVHIVATGKEDLPFDTALDIATKLEASGITVMLDDRRDPSAGVKFKDAELIGIPVIIVVGKSLAEGKIELRNRKSGEKSEVAVGDAISAVTTLIASLS